MQRTLTVRWCKHSSNSILLIYIVDDEKVGVFMQWSTVETSNWPFQVTSYHSVAAAHWLNVRKIIRTFCTVETVKTSVKVREQEHSSKYTKCSCIELQVQQHLDKALSLSQISSVIGNKNPECCRNPFYNTSIQCAGSSLCCSPLPLPFWRVHFDRWNIGSCA